MSDEVTDFTTVTDHKYIDQRCHDGGCQALVFDETVTALVAALKQFTDNDDPESHSATCKCAYCIARAALQKASKL